MGVRPPLPYRSANPHIKAHLNSQKLPAVKYQVLTCQGKDILVGRMKIDTPTETGHAFILRRYDTLAVSLTTMFRAAFPSATDYEEKMEVQWVKDTYDLTGTNGSTKDATLTRLAGTWVHPPLAIELGKTYALGALIESLIEAYPDPSAVYRRSGKSAPTTNNAVSATPAPAVPSPIKLVTTTTTTIQSSSVVVKPPSGSKSLPTPSPTAGTPPAKRRKESSPAPIQSHIKPPSVRSSPVKPSSTTLTSQPTARRSVRTKSQSPAPRTFTAATTVKTPKRALIKENSSVTPGGSELTAVDEEGPAFEAGPAGTELMEEDLQEQKRLIEDMKAQRAAAAAAEKLEDSDMDVSDEASSAVKKRDREEDEQPLQFDFKQPEVEERQIATNRRVGRFDLEPRTKSFAWGVAAFAVGMSAMTFLPSIFG